MGSGASGKLNNPGKRYYLKLSVKCADRAIAIVDSNGVSLVRKAMIKCVLAQDID